MKSISALSLLSILALTSCISVDSGKSSGNENKKPDIVESTTEAENKPDQPIEKPPIEPDTIYGNYLVGASKDNTGYATFTLRGKNLDHIEMMGRKIPLFDPAAKSINGWNHIGNGMVSSKEQLSYARHGAFQHGENVYIFAQGERTEKMPTSGHFSYEGQATILTVQGKEVFPDLKDKETRLLVEETTSYFDVDFGKKSVVGSIKLGEGRNILLEADIKGSKFTRWGGFKDYDVAGEFYGKNAEELAGTFYLLDKVSGTFGAKRKEEPSEEKPHNP